MKTSALALSSLILLISVIFSSSVFSQTEQPGMQVGQHNYYTFSNIVNTDQAELARYSNSQGHPEYGTLPYNAPCSDCIELIEKRTSDTRTFLTVGKNGKEFLSQKGYMPLHYQNELGQWITYNPKLKKESNTLFRENNQFYDIQINTLEGSIIFENKLENRAPLKFHKNLSFESLDNSGNVIQTIPANWSNFTAGEEGVKVINIFPNIDLTILVYRDIIKTNFTVKQNVGAFQIREVLDADVFNKLNQNNSTPSTLSFTENNELAYQMDEIKIFGADQKRDFVLGNYSIENGAVVYQWNQSEFNQLTYPIIIDPTVTSNGSLPQASITGAGTWANNGAFTTGCIYNLAVPTPANCQITDIAWTFTYSAQNGGVLADGACRFGYAGCLSPAAAGFFWFCNNAGAGGTCAGANVSIFADFAACIPAPACAPYNMNFTMEFFDAWGSGNILNCDPTYVSAASAWTMTITGETVDEPAAPTSSAGGLICEGSSTNLTATAAFGVPPYVFSWNNGGGVGNPVSVSPVANTVYTCTITDACGQVATNTININVQPAPDAGVSAVTSFCPTDPVTSLLGVLTGTPDATGTWAGPSALTGGSAGNFNPATMAAGVYTYNVPGVAPCVATSSTVTVSFNPSPNAGTNGAVAFCPSDPTNDLFTQLGGAPDAGGIWSPAMASGTGVFNPAVDLGGVYTYTVTNPCGSISADVTVTINPLPVAGSNGTLNICTSDPSTDLFLNLGGSPDAGGSWSPAMASGTGVFNPAVDAGGTYTYTVTNGCGNASATVTVTVVAAPNAGSPGAVSFCSGDAPADLFGSLGGTPDAGGTWAPALASGTGVFNPAVDAGGVYSYTVSASCGNATSDVTVTLNPSPDAGTDGAISFCTSDPSTDLFTSLGGTPDAGGTWSPAMASGTGVFNPATDPAGVYTYTVTNGCGSIAANVTVTINSNPSPGTAGSIAFCATDPTADLFNSLGGAPTLGGSWSPALASGTGVFNPAVDAAGVYTYSVNACGGGVLTADVTVTLNPAPDAGTDNTTTLCDNAPTVDLFTLVLGTPSAGGTWSPSMASGTGVFDPATDPAGVYVYTVTNSCGSASSNITVTVNSCAPPAAGFTVLDTLVCLGECFTFLDTTKFAPTTWHWDFGGATTPDTSIVQNPSICVDSVGTFVITLTASNVNGTSTATMNLVVADMPSVTIVQDTTIDMNGTAFLTSNVTPTGGDYTWSSPTDDIPCPSCQSNYLTPLLTSEYILNYVTIEGCEATDTALVTVLFMDLVDVPNGFSPNSDGNNDLLFVKGEGITSMNFVIHNRYGQQVFQSDAQDVGWDGSMNGNPQNPGVFVWYLQYSLIDGTSNFKKGNVTLIK